MLKAYKGWSRWNYLKIVFNCFLIGGNLCVTSGNNQVADTFELGSTSETNFATQQQIPYLNHTVNYHALSLFRVLNTGAITITRVLLLILRIWNPACFYINNLGSEIHLSQLFPFIFKWDILLWWNSSKSAVMKIYRRVLAVSHNISELRGGHPDVYTVTVRDQKNYYSNSGSQNITGHNKLHIKIDFDYRYAMGKCRLETWFGLRYTLILR